MRAESQASTGAGSGVWGLSAGDHGTGVVGEATQNTGTTYGVGVFPLVMAGSAFLAQTVPLTEQPPVFVVRATVLMVQREYLIL